MNVEVGNLMSNVVILRPELLWLALPLIPLLFLASRRLRGLAPWRRRTALTLQSLSALLLLLAVAEPALARPNENMSLVVVLDSSGSVSETSRQQAVTYAQNLLSSSGPTDHIRFVSAGAQATILTEEQVASGAWADQTIQNPKSKIQNQTDLAAGLRLAGSLLTDTGKRRVVLVSDGWETQGQAADEGARLQARGIQLNVVALTALGDPEIIVRSLDAPPYARIGDSIQSELRVFSTKEISATLRVQVDGAPPATRAITLKAGENGIPIEQKAETEGFHRIEASIQGVTDTVSLNNTASAALVVKPQPRVLVLEDRPGEAAMLASALNSRQITVDVRPSSAVPSQVNELDRYDSIVLNNVAATSLSLDQQRTLQEYVRSHGRGLVTVGGNTSYAKGGYMDSVFEEILPVSSKPGPRPEEGNTAMILIMDRSFSMDEYRSQETGTSKFGMAKEAARLAIDSLRPGDTVGVLSFDTENLWTVPVRTIQSESDKEPIKTLITNIDLGGGTSIYPAVEEGFAAMQAVSAPARHLVLLTDGREYGMPQYEPLIRQIREQNITLSTIGIGRDVDKELLTRLARLGLGRYYFTERLENIPKIVFKELDLALKEAVVEGNVQPHLLSPSPILRGLSPQNVPQLRGYNITTPKEDALVGLVADQPHPLLAHWNYGLGRVVSFTSDAGPGWASRWLTWDDFARFWSQAVRWSMASPINRQLQPSVSVVSAEHQVVVGESAPTQNSEVARISVESLNPDNSFANLADITAGVRSPSGVVTTTILSQTAPGRYEADVPLSEPGAYEVRVVRQGDAQMAESAGFSVPPDREYQQAGTNDRLLRQLNGGSPYLAEPQQALDRAGLQGASPDLDPLWSYFLAPSLLLLLVSVAIRRIDFRLRRRRRRPS